MMRIPFAAHQKGDWATLEYPIMCCDLLSQLDIMPSGLCGLTQY